MTRRGIGVALAAVLLVACGRQDEAAAPVARVEVPPGQAAGGSCRQDCGGTVVTIQCDAGQTAVCECGPAPAALCRAPASGGTQ